jgi:uncharacterized protein (TIGR03067 family)
MLVLAAPASGQEAAKIEGTWMATGGVSGNTKITEEQAAQLKMLVMFKEGKYSVTVLGKEVEAGTYKLDATKNPPTIDLAVTEGKDKGKTQLGLVKMEGEKMTIALGGAGKERPKTLEAGEGVEITYLKRSK